MDTAASSIAADLLKQDVTFVYAFFQAAELEARTTERYILVTLGGMYTYLATKEIPAHLVRLAWYAPALVAAFAAIRAFGLLWRQINLLGYLRQIEQRFPFPGGVSGWAQSDASHAPVIAVSATAFYVVLIVVTCLVAHHMTRPARVA